MPVHQRLRDVGGRAHQDLRAARRRASETGSDVARRARQDLRTARQEVDPESVTAAAQRAGGIVVSAGETMSQPASDGVSDARSRDVYRRAEQAAAMGAPVQASLEPMTGSDEIGSFVTGVGPADPGPALHEPAPGGGIDDLLFFDGPAEAPADGLGVGFFGPAAPVDEDDERDASGPLEFDDTMLYGGEW